MTNTTKLTELPPVARNINLPCKKCATDRFFIVLTHTSTTSAKVKCEVCGSTKSFKLSTPKPRRPRKTSSSSGKSRSAKKVQADESLAWSDLKEQIGVESLIPYNMKSKYQLASAIEHPKFGIGFVTYATEEKIDVTFEEGGRALVHNRN